MFHAAYEKMVAFASEGELADELSLARKEYEQRTGELFETDPAFERRIAAFLEWYVLDRGVSERPHVTPAKLYIDAVSEQLTTPQLGELRALTKTRLSLFEFKRVKGEHMHVVDLLGGAKYEVFERRRTAGLDAGDIMEARLVTWNERPMFSESVGVHPREARKAILKVAKQFRKAQPPSSDGGSERIDLVHRVAYYSNRCERYSHVDPRQIFAEL